MGGWAQIAKTKGRSELGTLELINHIVKEFKTQNYLYLIKQFYLF